MTLQLFVGAQPAPEENDVAEACVETTIRFRDFAMYPAARVLTRSGAPVDIGSRAFDLLLCLLRSRGRLVCKEQIVDQVWPTTTVDESNLRFQMASLRRVLGCHRDLIKTIPGRGYLFAAEGPGSQNVSQGVLDPQLESTWVESQNRGHLIIVLDRTQDLRDALQKVLQMLTPESGGALAQAKDSVHPPRLCSTL